MFHGCLTALITPFDNGIVDEVALRRLVQFQIDQGVHGLVSLGTTGESPTLSDDEYEKILCITIKAAAGSVPVIAGVGSNNPLHAIHLARRAQALGANGVLAVAGYYNRPSQEGLYQHFRSLHDAVNVPIIIYNIPPRTIVDIQPETMWRLSELPRVIGVKDATGDLTRIFEEGRLIGSDFAFLSGDDSTAVAYNVQGGVGCISVLSNVLPAVAVAIQTACQTGDYSTALELQRQVYPLIRALFLEPSPAGVKYAAQLMGLCRDECRLPIVPLHDATKILIQNALEPYF